MQSNNLVVKLGTLLLCVCVVMSTGVAAKGVVRTPGGEGGDGGKAGGGGPTKPETPGKSLDDPKPPPSAPKAPPEKPVIEKIKDYFSRAAADAEHIGAGRFDRVSENTKGDLANMLKDQFDGRQKTPEFDIGNNTVVWGERGPDGGVAVGFRKKY